MDPLDWNALKDNCAGDEGLMREVLDLFRSEAQGLLGDVRAAVSGKDALAVKRTAHRLKGALVSLGAMPSVEQARELERLGSSGQLAGADATYDALEREMARLVAAISVSHAA